MEPTGTIFKIKKYALHDGPGIRTTIFLKGCPLNCWWCHNPEGQAFEPQVMKNAVNRSGEKEVVGKTVFVKDLLNEIGKDLIFYDESGGGVTFSGGEPLSQPTFLISLLKACNTSEIHTAVDTAGYAPLNVFKSVVAHARLVLFDLKIMDRARHYRYTGVSNETILQNLETLSGLNLPVRIRFPIIAGITDQEDNIKQIAAFAAGIDRVEGIDILPYHPIAKDKYRRLEMEYQLNEITPPEKAFLNQIKAYFESFGFQVNIGG